jgi:hypothetical protein
MPTITRTSGRVLLPALLALALVSMLVLRTSAAAFTATTDNEGNAFRTGAIDLADDRVGALFDVSGMVPGDAVVRCITVTYTGSVDPGTLSQVRVYSGATEDDTDGLASALTLQVEEGAGATDAACTGFTTPSVVTTGAFSAFLARVDHADGVGSWVPAATGAQRSYRITAALPANAPDSTQGSALTGVSFVWELQAS